MPSIWSLGNWSVSHSKSEEKIKASGMRKERKGKENEEMKYTRHPRKEWVLGSWLHISQGVVDRKGKYGIPCAVVLGRAGVWEMGRPVGFGDLK